MTKTLSVDSKTIDLALSELAKLIMRLDKVTNKKTRKEQSLRKYRRYGYNPRCCSIREIEKERRDKEQGISC